MKPDLWRREVFFGHFSRGTPAYLSAKQLSRKSILTLKMNEERRPFCLSLFPIYITKFTNFTIIYIKVFLKIGYNFTLRYSCGGYIWVGLGRAPFACWSRTVRVQIAWSSKILLQHRLLNWFVLKNDCFPSFVNPVCNCFVICVDVCRWISFVYCSESVRL